MWVEHVGHKKYKYIERYIDPLTEKKKDVYKRQLFTQICNKRRNETRSHSSFTSYFFFTGINLFMTIAAIALKAIGESNKYCKN
ncbi:hypothetical protein A5885_002123 [Enterococcus sp. 8E11_MSG4843]|nr:hypothetical protein A5885_002123 [Enterococcus sp. 8E11_MSG4843]